MKIPEIKLNVFDKQIKAASEKLRKEELEDAYKMILDAISLNPNSPKPHNLLGIWFELNGKEDIARKHYRIAYVLDPTFKPACNNLERISTIFIKKQIPIDYGVEPELQDEEEKRGTKNVRKYE